MIAGRGEAFVTIGLFDKSVCIMPACFSNEFDLTNASPLQFIQCA